MIAASVQGLKMWGGGLSYITARRYIVGVAPTVLSLQSFTRPLKVKKKYGFCPTGRESLQVAFLSRVAGVVRTPTRAPAYMAVAVRAAFVLSLHPQCPVWAHVWVAFPVYADR